MAFPLSDFSAADELDLRSYRERLDWHSGFGVCAMVPAAGAGEFFSITRDEYGALLAETIAARLPGVPVIAPVGFGTKMAIDYARHAEEAGADGLLLLPPI
ncbi:MAG: dihydrodipicolinate synthase family protein [Devosia ginsengisoli]|nr:dihydrodipicolinate synthase family protein [Devosia ginsengisoli]MCR6670759.1 dihydrodipicolinate synthase family protein [Devosia ginsengisoli]